ncbi:hypothetical protein M9434_004571 [Picochlorum sp. BPE23]|nr:hypothetical protein M9434_004571 [Picochlorum sp. BPE23]
MTGSRARKTKGSLSSLAPKTEYGDPYLDEYRLLTDGLIELHGKPTRMDLAAIKVEEEEDGGASTHVSHDDEGLTQGHHQVYVLDSLVRTILSQNTTDKTSIRSFRKLKETFDGWEAVLNAPHEDVADAIREGGLADIKVVRIKALLEQLKSDVGECSLEWLRDKDTEFIKEYLGQFTGVGPKTVSCTLMFALGRDDFPVDTHVFRIGKDLGWIPKSCRSREDAYEYLNVRIPDGVKFDLHVLLVAHGKVCAYCSSRKTGSIAAKECPVRILKGARRTSINNNKGAGVSEDACDLEIKSESLLDEDDTDVKQELKRVKRESG